MLNKLKIVVKHAYCEDVDNGFFEASLYFNKRFMATVEHTDLMGGFDEVTKLDKKVLTQYFKRISEIEDYVFCAYSSKKTTDGIEILYQEENVALLSGETISVHEEAYLATSLVNVTIQGLEEYKSKTNHRDKGLVESTTLFDFKDDALPGKEFAFVKKTSYYESVVYEFNLPAGHTCPHAKECVVKVDRESGKFDNQSVSYRCYAAAAERFPGVRDHRWKNFDYVSKGNKVIVPHQARHIRIHASGDFFSQAYFDMWLEVCRDNPDKEFWAYTKSVNYWVNRLDEIPDNLEITGSYGGKYDTLIDKHGLKRVKVVSRSDIQKTEKQNVVIYDKTAYHVDTSDNIARKKGVKQFLLLDNNETPEKEAPIPNEAIKKRTYTQGTLLGSLC